MRQVPCARLTAASRKEILMNNAELKERALEFLRNLEKPDPAALDRLLADNFEFEMMGRLPGITPIKGKKVFIENFPKTISSMFPNGLNITFETVIGEAPHVAVQAASNTTAA